SGGEGNSVYASTFQGNQVALSGGSGVFQYNTITNNSTGVQAYDQAVSLSYNTIISNTVGIELQAYGGYQPAVNHNNIYGNIPYNLKITGPYDVAPTNNWWGTTDTSAIDAGIFDGHDDGTSGLVTYQPIL